MKKLLFISLILFSCRAQKPCNENIQNDILFQLELIRKIDSLENCPKSIIYIPIKDTCR